jgi:hypothetical protein
MLVVAEAMMAPVSLNACSVVYDEGPTRTSG